MKENKCYLLYKRVCSLFILPAVLTVLFYTSEANALSIYFTNYNVIDFGTVDLSEGTIIINDFPIDGLVVRCEGTPGWTLEVKIEQELRHESNPNSVIPNTNFKWYVESTTGDSNNVAPIINQQVEFTLYDNLIYTGTGESQTDITMKFYLELPPDLQWGNYNTDYGDIVFTLTE